MMDLLPHILLITGTFLLAGLVKGVIGLGLPTVAMGLLGLAMPPAYAAALLIVPSLVTNVWQLLAGPRFGALFRRLWGMMLGIVAGTLTGSGLITGAAAPAAAAALGGALALYALVGLAKLRLRVPPASERWAGPLVGMVTGLVTGATGVFVIPAVPYLGSLGLERDDLVQALGLSFTASTLALAAGLAWHGALPLQARASRCSPSCRRLQAWRWVDGCARGCGPRPSGCASSWACWCWGANSFGEGWRSRNGSYRNNMGAGLA